MTRRPVINRDELFFVADKMVAQGKQVTALSILASLGGGSLTTIYKYLEEWESLRRSKTPTMTNDHTRDEHHMPTSDVSQLASTEGWREVAALKQEVEQLRQELQLTQSALTEMRTSMREASNREVALLKEQQTELSAKVDNREQQRDAATREAAELRGYVQSLKQQNADLLAILTASHKKH